MGYFVSILLFFPLLSPPIPNDGWIQWAFEFPNRITCEAFVAQERAEIKDVQCMTVAEVVDANTKLGHEPQWQTIPKKKPNQPMI